MAVSWILAAFFAWMGGCNLLNSRWFLGKRIRYMIPQENVPAYRRLVGLAGLILALVYVSNAVFGHTKPAYLMIAVAAAFLVLFANKKYAGHWFF